MPWVELAREDSERGELVLREREQSGPTRHLELRANGVFVMDTALTESEEALAATALAGHPAPARVLVGGLGLGYTARRVLADPRVAVCTIVEIEPALVRWFADGLVPSGPDLLGDPRVEVWVGDLFELLDRAAGYDLVLLDVDNGPSGLVHEENHRLYQAAGLAALQRALAPSGELAIWSASSEPGLLAALRTSFDRVAEVAVPVVLQGRSEEYWLLLARGLS